MSQANVKPVIRIRATRGWAALGLADLWQHRELLLFMIWREIRIRYRQMALGPLWMLLVPVVNMVVFTIAFNRIAGITSDTVPYPLFAYAALVPWHFFSSAAGSSATSLVANLNVITKVYFPRLLVPMASVFVGLFDLCISIGILLGIMAVYGYAPTTGALLLPMYVLLALATALAIGLWLAVLAVKFRDVRYGITLGLQIWMFLTPVIYPVSLVPEAWQTLYRLNPMAGVVEGFRWALLGTGHPPDWVLAASAGIVLLLVVSGAYLFRRTERTIVDHV